MIGTRWAVAALDAVGRWVNALVWRDVQGRHHAFRGREVDVLEDGQGQRWLRAADLRKVVTGLPGDGRLLALYPSAVRRMGRHGAAYVEAEALVAEVLARAQEPMTLKLRHWVDREVAQPARRRRGA